MSDWNACEGVTCPCPNHHIPSLSLYNDPPLSTLPAYNNLTKSNNAPSPSEDATLRARLGDLEALEDVSRDTSQRLVALRAKLEKGITVVNEHLKALSEERSRIALAIEEHQQLLGPIRRLPPEILSQILLHVEPFPSDIVSKQTSTATTWSVPRKQSSLWTVELVCRRWRTEVIDLPQLWSCMTIVVTKTNFVKGNYSYVQQIAKHLGRARLSPLSICILDENSCEPELPTQILMMLLPMASRIVHLRLCLPLRMLHGLKPFRFSLQALKTLAMLNTNFDDDPTVWPSDNLFLLDQASNVKSLELLEFDTDLLPMPMPPNIQHFQADHLKAPATLSQTYPRPHDFLALLRDKHALIDCVIRLEMPSLEDVIVPVWLNKLSSLTLRTWPARQHHQLTPDEDDLHPVRQFLSHTTFPVLATLDVSTVALGPKGGKDTSRTFTAIRDCIERYNPPLSSLHFDNGEIDPDDLTFVLRAVSSTLTNLQLKNIGESEITNDVLRELYVQPKGQVLLPHLRTLYIDGRLQFDGDVLIGMVESRWRVAPLGELGLCWHIPAGENATQEEFERELVWKHLETNISEGLKLITSIVHDESKGEPEAEADEDA